MVARRAHNPKVVGSNPASATKFKHSLVWLLILLSGYEPDGRIIEGTEQRPRPADEEGSAQGVCRGRQDTW